MEEGRGKEEEGDGSGRGRGFPSLNLPPNERRVEKVIRDLSASQTPTPRTSVYIHHPNQGGKETGTEYGLRMAKNKLEQIIGRSIAIDQLRVLVDVKIPHGTVRSNSGDPVLFKRPRDSLLIERPDLIDGRLTTAVEVLRSVLADDDLLIGEHRVPFAQPILVLLGGRVVEMNTDIIKLEWESSATILDEEKKGGLRRSQGRLP